MSTRIATLIRKANGYFFDVFPAQVQNLKRDQSDQGMSGWPQVINYPIDEDFTPAGDIGFDHPFMFATGVLSGCVQAVTTLSDLSNYVRDSGRLKADLWRALTADRSNGGLTDDMTIRRVAAEPISDEAGGSLIAVAIFWRATIRHIVNDPTQTRNYTNPAA